MDPARETDFAAPPEDLNIACARASAAISHILDHQIPLYKADNPETAKYANILRNMIRTIHNANKYFNDDPNEDEQEQPVAQPQEPVKPPGLFDVKDFGDLLVDMYKTLTNQPRGH